MKILLIHNYYRYKGGEETYFESLAGLLRKEGQQVITYTKSNKKIDNISDKFSIVKNLFFAKQVEVELTELIKKNRPDIAQFQNIFPLITPTAYRVCKKFNIPIVQRISNYRYLCPKGILFRKGKICEDCIRKKFKYPAIIHGCYDGSRLASLIFAASFYFHKEIIKSFDLVDKFIFPTEFTRNYYVKYAGIKRSKTIVVPTFTNINELKIPKGFKVKEKNYFLYVGRLSEEKGIIKLLDVFKTIPNKKLIVIGDGPLKKQVDEYSKHKNIILKGHLPRNIIKAYMQEAKAIIIPSLWYDVMPNVLIEGTTFCISIITPKTKVFTELNIDNKVVMYKNSVKELKKVILK